MRTHELEKMIDENKLIDIVLLNTLYIQTSSMHLTPMHKRKGRGRESNIVGDRKSMTGNQT